MSMPSTQGHYAGHVLIGVDDLSLLFDQRAIVSFKNIEDGESTSAPAIPAFNSAMVGSDETEECVVYHLDARLSVHGFAARSRRYVVVLRGDAGTYGISADSVRPMARRDFTRIGLPVSMLRPQGPFGDFTRIDDGVAFFCDVDALHRHLIEAATIATPVPESVLEVA